MLLSIIIINYNTFQLTCDCIHSIQDTTAIAYEIILIDNNSRERPAADFLTLFPALRLYALNENVGYGRANNLGMQNAKGKYVLLLNSDTLAKEQAIDETVNYLEQNPEVDILGCRVETNGGATQRTVYEYKGELSFFRSIVFFIKRNALIKELIAIVYKQIQKRKKNGAETLTSSNHHKTQVPEKITPNYCNGKRIGSLVGVFLLLKKSVFIESKGFDPDFFMYDEELDWFLNRLRKYNIVFYPHVHIIHFYGKSDVYKKMNLQHRVSQYLFWYKMSYAHYFLFCIYNLFEIPSKALLTLFTFKAKHVTEIPNMLKVFPYVFFDIPRYSNRYGARKEMLKLKSLKRANL